MDDSLRNALEAAMRSKHRQQISIRTSEGRVTVLRGVLRERFYRKGEAVLVLESGLPLSEAQILGIRTVNDSTLQ